MWFASAADLEHNSFVRKQRKVFVLVLLGVVILWVLISLISRPREPKYGGHPLHYWLEMSAAPGEESRNLVKEALQHMGTNALPCLLS